MGRPFEPDLISRILDQFNKIIIANIFFFIFAFTYCLTPLLTSCIFSAFFI